MQREDKYGPKTIESFEPLLWRLVREIVFDRSKWDDCVQEARIRVWQILQSNPAATRGYIGVAARNRIRQVSQSSLTTGYTGQQGTPVDPIRRNDTAYFGSPDEIRGGVIKLLFNTYAEEDEEVSHGKSARVSAAVQALPQSQQEYIEQRFYRQVPYNQMTRSGRHWYTETGARERLREDLKDLAA